MNYYNEIDPFAADWLRRLIAAGALPPGDVDERSIAEVRPADLEGYNQCHFFAGVGGWPLALAMAGWSESVPVWTGSCPCQPFSQAGRGRGVADERHLWPEFFRLIEECRPAIVLGEQVASAAGRAWLAGVRADLEGVGYGVGAADLCAASFGAPHIRQRLYWVGLADTGHDERGGWAPVRHVGRGPEGAAGADEGGGSAWRSARGLVAGAIARDDGDAHGGVEYTAGDGAGRADAPLTCGHGAHNGLPGPSGAACTGLGDAEGRPGGQGAAVLRSSGWDEWAVGEPGPWSDSRLVACDESAFGRGIVHRRVGAQPSVQPLAPRLPRGVGPELAGVEGVAVGTVRDAARNRTGRLKGYGNAIVPPLAARFVEAVMEEVRRCR